MVIKAEYWMQDKEAHSVNIGVTALIDLLFIKKVKEIKLLFLQFCSMSKEMLKVHVLMGFSSSAWSYSAFSGLRPLCQAEVDYFAVSNKRHPLILNALGPEGSDCWGPHL